MHKVKITPENGKSIDYKGWDLSGAVRIAAKFIEQGAPSVTMTMRGRQPVKLTKDSPAIRRTITIR